MDSLYLFQFACLNFMVINALVIGITHYYARWRNRRYEQSRWMLFAAFTVLAVQYFVQMRYGFRAAGDDKGAAVNLLFYAPSFTFIAMSIYNLGGGTHSRRKLLYWICGITNAAIFTIYGFLYYLSHSLPLGRWLYVIEVLYVSMVFYSIYLIRIEMKKRKEILNTMVATDLMPYFRYAHTSFIYLFIASVIIPFAILYTPALYIVGPVILATLLFLTISFVMLGAAYVPTEELLTTEEEEEDEEKEEEEEEEEENDDEKNDDEGEKEDEEDEERETEKLNRRWLEIQSSLDQWCDNHGYKDTAVNMPALSNTLDIPRHELTQFFAEYRNTTFRIWLSEIRLNAAKKMMQDYPEYSNDIISSECGFSSRSYLYKIFKEKEGCTPNLWRSKNSQLSD